MVQLPDLSWAPSGKIPNMLLVAVGDIFFPSNFEISSNAHFQIGFNLQQAVR